MSYWWERVYPFLAGLLASAGWWWFSPAFHAQREDVLSASLTIGSILTGFLATSKAILLSLDSNRVMQQLKGVGYNRTLVSYLAQAILFSFAYAVLSLVGFFLNGNDIYWIVWVGLGVAAALTFVRVVLIQLKILAA